ncbi:holo-ACP synthase [Pseudalkalibacillus salsuginis]|uniref:holo-ACP synthase n=1 Tax=Pseudalkalibacillus salsuginis TaxID=2910972 RepID=UPI001F19421D|nr:holo-ACP synthase [Pseudalkalibacillus salsuginis]MCF6411797.1 holo-ACP synthase [Pseudalkalibacillus salsuginis]
MIIGIGIDIIEIERIKHTYERQPKFAERILTETELRHFHIFKRRKGLEFLAGRFAAKEAYAKAAGTGIGKRLSWKDIQILPNEAGKPIIEVRDPEWSAHVSISHSKEFVVAQVILESSSS